MGTNILVGEGFRDVGRKVVTYRDRPNLSFYELAKKKGKAQFGLVQVAPGDQASMKIAMLKRRQGEVNKVILHHDGMPSSAGCFNVLRDRGLSTHFMIDRDGTIYQPLNVRLRTARPQSSVHQLGLDLRERQGIDVVLEAGQLRLKMTRQ